MAPFLPSLLLWSFSFLFTSGVYSASNFTLKNSCDYTVWPAVSSNGGVTKIPTTGFILQKGESKLLQMPDSWNGRFWGRTECSENSPENFSCVTGDCGSGKLECFTFSKPPTTLVEFAIDQFNGMDFYDVSVVDGYNLPVSVVPSVSTNNCTTISCSINLNDTCPSELKVMGPRGDVVACQNACEVLKQQKFCNKPTLYSDVFKKACPTAYSYALDDTTSLYTCAAAGDYTITFCPFPTDSTSSAVPPLTPASEPTLAQTPKPHSPPPNPGKGGLSARVIVSIVVLIIFAIIFLTLTICLWRRKAKKKHNFTMEATGDPNGNQISEAESLQYDFSDIKAATNNFSASNKIGEGGFGEVFKGTLNNGKQVAVKRLSKSSGQGEQAFKNEVQVVAKLQHRNLVRLLGYCLTKEEKILIFEYVPNGSLDAILFDDIKQYSMDWSKRYKIIGGLARGILYLHDDSRLRIIHRDIKASNILLDNDMNAKISDFGLAKIVGFDESQGNTSRVVGTFGYMPPEYIMNGQFSVKSDVFSFGVLLLEIISGKKNNRFYQSSEHLLSHAWKLWKDDKPLELVDRALGDSFSEYEVTRCIHIGLLCVQDDLNERPTMASVVLMLNNSSMSLPIPHEPAFFLQSGMMPTLNQPENVICSANDVTISELFPR